MNNSHCVKIRRFQLSDYETHQPLVVIEAADEEHALTRCKLISSLIDLDDHDIFAVAEHVSGTPVIVPFFTDAYFQVVEVANKHIH